jgi:hypothetical protein
LVARANGLAESTLTCLAFSQSLISGSQADLLLEARCRAPEQFTRDEAELVAIALDTPLITD